jgi:hypothetical protein
VRQLQGHPPQGRGARDLHEPKAQAAARIIEFPILDFSFRIERVTRVELYESNAEFQQHTNLKSKIVLTRREN